ncbi:hypothetical protein [Natrononativus amylolyticus]|uniref:hypothetical protein n=1 Tax=Natrononativus amylolyticus TaxID=2963434 RepID=UPI0020CC14F6|nr:hypothetical protein [Natrononativus amylolyticus]
MDERTHDRSLESGTPFRLLVGGYAVIAGGLLYAVVTESWSAFSALLIAGTLVTLLTQPWGTE